MALNCNLSALVLASRCLLEPTTGEQEREAIDLYLRVKNLAASGGVDYSNDLTALQTAAKEWQALVKTQIKAIDLYVDLQNAVDNGAVIDSDINALKDASKCFLCLPIDTKKQLLSFLKCSINSLGKPD